MELHCEPLTGGIYVYSSEEHRFGTDAFLLASFSGWRRKDIAADLGTGCGIIPMIMQRDNPPARVYGVEIQEQGIMQFRMGIEKSGLSEERVTPVLADLKVLWNDAPYGQCDLVTCNPPYMIGQHGIKNDDDENKIISPVYLPEKDAVEYIVISKNNDDYVIEGLYKDGNIFSISNGTKLAPAYASYDMEIVDIQENGANVTEVYDDYIYTYGRDFKISYDVLPKDTYVYGMNIIYAENNGNNYGYYTNGKEVIFQGTEAKATCKTSGEDSEYKYVKGLDYLKEMIKNNLSISSKDRRQAKRHFLRGEKRSKGYIATRNYRVINTALRTDTEDTLEEDDKLTIEALDRITENNKLSKNTLLVRNVNLDYLTSVFNIKLQDGSGLTNEEFMKMSNETKLYILEEFKKFEGIAVKEKAYLSTSLIPSANIMNDKPVRFIIKAPKGTKGYLTLNIGESEFVMPRNTSLVLDTINYDETNDKYIVEATVVQE